MTNQEIKLQVFLTQLQGVFDSLVPDSIKAFQLTDIFASQRTVVSEDGVKFVLSNFARRKKVETQELNYKEFCNQLNRILRDLYSIGILNLERTALAEYVKSVSVRNGSDEMVEDLNALHSIETVNNVVLQKLREIDYISEDAVKIGYQILTTFLPPNLFYDEQDTNIRIAEAVARVARARGTVLENERIIQSHEKITAEHIQKLNSLAAVEAELYKSEGQLQQLLPIIGRVLILCLTIGIIGIFLRYWRPMIYRDVSRVILIALILLIVLFIAHFINRLGFSEYLIPVAMVPMLLTAFFDTRLGFLGAATLAILLGGMPGNEYMTFFLSLVIGTAGGLTLRKVRSRIWIFYAIISLAIAYIITASAFSFILHSPSDRLLQNIISGLINALACPLLTYGLMVIFEYLFNVTTDATLLELSDLNRPLLRDLALHAPGTYHHSVLVGTLSEAAAEAIGANSLLARVGSYYHDIGKLEKQEYFVENQKANKNPHDKLTPSMSALVIINHIKRGLETADRNGLPKDLRDFISQHHGTNLVSYFYHKAKQQCGEDEVVDENNFRYPGPKPQTKEIGIVMLADAVEAITRSLREPSISRIRNVVRQTVAERFTSGELDESPLTLRDLNQIRDSFERTLGGVFHGRIEYPDDKRSGTTKSETGKEKRATKKNGSPEEMKTHRNNATPSILHTSREKNDETSLQSFANPNQSTLNHEAKKIVTEKDISTNS